MRVVFEAEIEGKVPLKSIVEMKSYPHTIRLVPDDKGILERISIEKEVTDFEKYVPSIEIRPQKGIISIPRQDFSEEEKIMQHIESFGALDFGINKIKWETPRITWLPDNDEEASKLTLYAHRKSYLYDTPKTPITLSWLQETVLHRKRVANLVSPLSFFRIGSNLYHSFHYSEAFLNFYLMLEGFFGEGQSKNHKVEKAFANSTILKGAIFEAFDFLDKDTTGDSHKIWLENFLKEKKWPYNEMGLIKAIICVRGNLSHYYFKSSRKQRDSFNEKENESIACITMMLCMFSTFKLRFEPFQARQF